MRIVALNNGKIIGRIKNTVFLPGKNEVLGFCISCGRWVKRQKVLHIKNVKYIGRDAVMVQNVNEVDDYENHPDFREASKELSRIFGLPVMSNSGEELGYMEDIILNEKKLTIEGYVLTDGIIEDILKGKSIISFQEEMIFGEDTVIVTSDYKNIIMKNEISLKKAFRKGRRLRY